MTTHKAKPGGSLDKFVRMIGHLQRAPMSRAQVAKELCVQYDTADSWIKTLAGHGLVVEHGVVTGDKGGQTKLFGWAGAKVPSDLLVRPSPVQGGGVNSIEDIRLRCWIDEETSCWHWKGAKANGKVPSMRVPALGRTVAAGVAICFFKTGAEPRKGVVWHKTCTTLGCCNPEHRKAGTRKSQMQFANDHHPLHAMRVAKGRRAKSEKCSEAIAAEIRASAEPLKVLAERHGISESLVSRIRLQKLWKPHVAGASIFSLGASA